MKPWIIITLLAALVGLFGATGCATSGAVIVNTATGLGIQVAENPATSLYEAKLGYIRSEFAFVPSNKPKGTNVVVGGGAKEVANVLMEIRMENIFKGGLVYQRLAVGDEAVKQPGAALLFAKGVDGSADPAVVAAIQGIPAPDSAAVTATVPLAKAYMASDKKEAFDAVAKKSGYASFSAFLIDPKVNVDKVKTITQDLRNLGLVQ